MVVTFLIAVLHGFQNTSLMPPYSSLMSAPSTRAAEFGTREEAVAMVKRVQARFKKDGFEGTVKTINSGAKEFNERDLYAFIVDFTGRNHANAVTPAIQGKDIWDIK